MFKSEKDIFICYRLTPDEAKAARSANKSSSANEP